MGPTRPVSLICPVQSKCSIGPVDDQAWERSPLSLTKGGVDLVQPLDLLCLQHLLHSLPVHRVLGEGLVPVGLQLALGGLCTLGDNVGVDDLEVIELLLGEVDVQVPVEVLGGAGGERLPVDVDHRLLPHIEPDDPA